MKRLGCFVDDAGLREAVEAALALSAWSPSYARGGDTPDADVYLVDIPAHVDALARLAREGRSGVVALVDDEVRDDDAFRHASAVVVKPIDPRQLRVALRMAVEIRDRVRARDNWFQTTLRSLRDAVVCADRRGGVTFMNQAAEELTGVLEKDALGAPLDDVFAFDEADPGAEHCSLKRKDGETRVIEQTSSPIVSAAGELLGVVVVFRDVGERRLVQERLAASARLAALGTLAGGIAHEMNNPLSFVTANLEFVSAELQKQRAAGDEALDDPLAALADAGHGAARLAEIVKQLRIFIHDDSATHTTVDVHRAVSLAVRRIEHEARRRAELLVELASVPPAIADEDKLVQVLVHLLTNAVQAIDPDGPRGEIKVRTQARGDRIEIVVVDSGAGIAKEHLPHVFEPFFTTKPVGEAVGLGLSVSYALLASFGATLAVESAVGAGTTATVALLPVTKAAGDEQAGARILVVDDEPLVCTALRRVLERERFVVTTESDGRNAARRLVDAGERYDLIISDVMMRGFSGADLYDELARNAPSLTDRVVFMTGNPFLPQARELFMVTRAVHFEKPFRPETVVAIVRAVLDRRGRLP